VGNRLYGGVVVSICASTVVETMQNAIKKINFISKEKKNNGTFM
jgi:hypothetical protein